LTVQASHQLMRSDFTHAHTTQLKHTNRYSTSINPTQTRICTTSPQQSTVFTQTTADPVNFHQHIDMFLATTTHHGGSGNRWTVVTAYFRLVFTKRRDFRVAVAMLATILNATWKHVATEIYNHMHRMWRINN